jgi:hypothetical protein
LRRISRLDGSSSDPACTAGPSPWLVRRLRGCKSGLDHQRVILVTLKWAGATLGVLGASLTAANIGLSGLGFVALFLSSAAWTLAGLLMREPSIVLLNGVFLVINLMGAARWL